MLSHIILDIHGQIHFWQNCFKILCFYIRPWWQLLKSFDKKISSMSLVFLLVCGMHQFWEGFFFLITKPTVTKNNMIDRWGIHSLVFFWGGWGLEGVSNHACDYCLTIEWFFAPKWFVHTASYSHNCRLLDFDMLWLSEQKRAGKCKMLFTCVEKYIYKFRRFSLVFFRCLFVQDCCFLFFPCKKLYVCTYFVPSQFQLECWFVYPG